MRRILMSFIAILSYILSVILAIPGLIISSGESADDYSFSVDTSVSGDDFPKFPSPVLSFMY